MGFIKQNKEKTFLSYAFIAFFIVGLEIPILIIEKNIYNISSFSQLSLVQNVIHWIITCCIWGIGSLFLITNANKNGFCIFSNDKSLKKNILMATIFVILSTFVMYFEWGFRFKPIVEYEKFVSKYNSYGYIAFIFQYIYYLFESMLITLIIVFGQKSGEIMLKKYNIPWGGILCGLTWGLAHIGSKDILTGLILCLFSSIFYGSVYLCMRKDIPYSYLIIALMFIL